MFNRLLKYVFERFDTRQKTAKKRNLSLINAYFEAIFHAPATAQMVFQKSVKRLNVTVLSCILACGLAHYPAFANPMQPDPLSTAPIQTQQVKPKATYRWPILNDIIIIGEYRKAVFNNSTEITVGEKVSGSTLIQVEKNHVVLQRGNTKKRLNLTASGEFSITPAVEE